jgi:hypothetical protein
MRLWSGFRLIIRPLDTQHLEYESSFWQPSTTVGRGMEGESRGLGEGGREAIFLMTRDGQANFFRSRQIPQF